MFTYPHTCYVIKCKTPGYFYVGSTYREWFDRLQEHLNGGGCVWTRKHGVDRIVKIFRVHPHRSSQIENEMWMWYARRYGPSKVRGGDVTWSKGPLPAWVLPEEFGGTRRVNWG